MLFGSVCGINLNLVKAGVVIGILDFVSNVADVILDIEVYVGTEATHLVLLSLFVLATLCDVLLIHGALKLNHQLLIYWFVFWFAKMSYATVVLAVLTSISSVSLLLEVFAFELVEYGFNFIAVVIVWKLFMKIRERRLANFSIMPMDSQVEAQTEVRTGPTGLTV